MRTVIHRAHLACAISLLTLFAGCGGGGSDAMSADPGSGAGTTAAPTITAVAPQDGATDVPANNSIVSAAFNESMAPISGNSTFTLVCASPCQNPAGSATLNATGTVATFALAVGTSLTPATVYTATVTGTTSMASGLAIANPFTWQFTTGATLDSSRPHITATAPAASVAGATTSAPANTSITAVFSEDMVPATLTAASFTLSCTAPCVSPAGAVTYEVASRTAVFTPAAPLEVGSTYTATISVAATDLAGNALAGNAAALPAASDYVWQFTTSTAAVAANISVASTNPAAGQMAECPDAPINATFHVGSGLRMDPSSVNAVTFIVTGPDSTSTAVVAASVVIDATSGTIATFTPQTPLKTGGSYRATIFAGATGVKDLAIPANSMLANSSWDFTVSSSTGTCLAPIKLGAVAHSGTFGGSAGMTSSGTLTVINGDIGTVATGTSSITGLHDTAGDIYTQTPANVGAVNGTIYTCTHSTTGPTSAGPNAANCSIATQARLDAQAAYLALKTLPPGANPGANLAGLTLAPGVYTAPAGSFMVEGGDLTLDAAGNADAVWVFQMATTLSVGGPGAAAPQSIILAGGAQAKNVYWQVGSAATINAGGGGTMVGTIISQAGAAFSTAGSTTVVTLNGRALSLNASVTLVDTVINVPAP